MTYLEKVKLENPAMSEEEIIEEFCPHDFGYEENHDCDHYDYDTDCKACWNRKYKELADDCPTIKDSGDRTEFETGAVRDMREGKGRCDLIPLDVVAEYLVAPGENEPNLIIRRIHMFQETGNHRYLFTAINDFNMSQWKNVWTMLLDVAKHFEEGAKKYGENNWQKGIPVHCYIDSAVRHYLKFLRGDMDEPHDRAFVWNLMCCIWTCKHKPELNEYEKKDEE